MHAKYNYIEYLYTIISLYIYIKYMYINVKFTTSEAID